MRAFIHCVIAIAGSLFLATFLASCGGGGGSGGVTPNNEPGTVGILLTDAPSAQWDQAIATITSVTLIGADGGRVTIFSGSQTLDLLKLGDFSELFALSQNVPPGQYRKIRLELSRLTLNHVDPATGAVIDSTDAQLVGNGKIDLVPERPFTVGSGAVLFVELDFDMEKSLKITETGNGKVIVRPVVFVNIHTSQPSGRLSRIHGQIDSVDAIAGTLVLCQTDFASGGEDHVTPHGHMGGGNDKGDDDNDEGNGDNNQQGNSDDGQWDDGDGHTSDHCVTVNTDASTGIFGSDGLPQDFSGLAAGEEATVIGRLHRPDAPVPVPVETGRSHPFAFDAFVIEEGAVGAFSRIGGIVASVVDAATARFGLNVAAGQGIASDTALPVQLYDHSRIFNRLGQELTRDDIQAGRPALADGVLQIGTEDFLRSPLVVLGPGLPVETALHGHILSVDTSTGSLMLTTDMGDRCVDASTAHIFLVTSDVDGLSFARGALTDLQQGQNTAVFGTEGTDGCLIAGTILAETLLPT